MGWAAEGEITTLAPTYRDTELNNLLPSVYSAILMHNSLHFFKYTVRVLMRAGLRPFPLAAAGGFVQVTAHVGPYVPHEAPHVWYP